MTKIGYLLPAGFLAVLVASLPLANEAMAQKPTKRDAAIMKCVGEAQAAFGFEQDRQRAEIYKTCMTRAGVRP